MRMVIKNNITIKIITFVMIGIIGMLIVNKSIFTHSHKLADGTFVVHSHPYDRSNDSNPDKTHQHSKTEFLFFQNIEILFPLFFLTIAFNPFAHKTYFYFHITSSHAFACIILHKSRAPPIS
jgi:hypothetical protein